MSLDNAKMASLKDKIRSGAKEEKKEVKEEKKTKKK